MESGRGSCRLPRTLGTQSCSLKLASIQVMESGRGSRGGCRHSRSLGTQSCYLQVVLMCIVFTIHVQSVASKLTRNDTEVLARRREYVPWNKTYYKIERKCLDFHDTVDPSLFYYWPEDDSGFDFCCATYGASYKNFIYGISGPNLSWATYYDLGLINECLPYWKCLDLFEKMTNHTLYRIYCEFTDLRRFYKQRFFSDTVIIRGFLQSAIPFILVAEMAVIAFVAVYWFLRRRPRSRGSESLEFSTLQEATRKWRKAAGPLVLMDWTHLCLLAVIGNGLIEAVGRQRSMSPQSKTFYNYSRLYLFLSILLWCSSVLHQVAMYIAEIEISCDEARLSQSTDEATPAWAKLVRSGSAQVEEKINMAPEWKWQPIGAQAGILFCLWGFLTYFSDDATTGAVFGIIVSAAAPWSGLYASKVIVHTVPYILLKVYQNLIKARKNRALWPKARAAAFLLGSGRSHDVQLDDFSPMHEHHEGSTNAV